MKASFLKWSKAAVVAALLVGSVPLLTTEARAEFGDVVMNRNSDASGVLPAVFPHWFHRIRFKCKVCHTDLGFKFKAGGNDVTMASMMDGKYCGACHNGQIAWGIEQCALCHSGKAGTKTQVHEATITTSSSK